MPNVSTIHQLKQTADRPKLPESRFQHKAITNKWLRQSNDPKVVLDTALFRGSSCKSYKQTRLRPENFTFLDRYRALYLHVKTVLLGTFRYRSTRCAIGLPVA